MNKKKIRDLVGTSILIALVVVLQVIATFIKVGGVSISLALIPIVVGAILYGVKGGTLTGLAFGVVVMIMAISGADAGAHFMFNVRPFITCVLCLFKGAMAGFVPAVIYKALKGKNKVVSIVLATIAAPIINTGIFLLAAFTLYYDVLLTWANGKNLAVYVVTAIIGINFLFEFSSNAVLSPAVIRVVNVWQQNHAEGISYVDEEGQNDSTL